MDQTISKYWQRVREARERLGNREVCYMVSKESDAGAEAGVVSVMGREAAARAIARELAREATPKEIEALRQTTAEARVEIERRESERLRSHLFAPQFVNPGPAPTEGEGAKPAGDQKPVGGAKS